MQNMLQRTMYICCSITSTVKNIFRCLVYAIWCLFVENSHFQFNLSSHPVLKTSCTIFQNQYVLLLCITTKLQQFSLVLNFRSNIQNIIQFFLKKQYILVLKSCTDFKTRQELRPFFYLQKYGILFKIQSSLMQNHQNLNCLVAANLYNVEKRKIFQISWI